MVFRYLLLIFFALLIIAPGKKQYFSAYNPLPTLSNKPLINAYLFGSKKGVSRDLLKVHQAFNLQHLMTPSGLHLGSLLIIISLFTRRKGLLFSFLIVIGGLVFPYTGVDSLKRMVVFGIFRKNPWIDLSLERSFILTFLLTFIAGQYLENPLSFCLSFIFLGVLLTTRNKASLFILLFVLQALLSAWFNREFSPLGSIYGLIISLLSPMVFPLFILETLFPSLPFSHWWSFFLLKAHKVSLISFIFPFLCFIPVLYFWSNKKIRNLSFFLCLLFFATPLGIIKRGAVFSSPPPHSYSHIKRIKDGYHLKYANGMRCYSRIKGDEWSHHCYK